MSKVTDQSRRSVISIKSIALLAIGPILFVAFILLPYLVHASSSYFEVGAGLVAQGCSNGTNLSADPTTQCVGWVAPHIMQPLGLLSVALALFYGAIFMHYIRVKALFRDLKKLLLTYLVLALMTVTISSVAFATLRSHSQAHTGPVFTTAALQARYRQGMQLSDASSNTQLSSPERERLYEQSRALLQAPQPTIGYGMLPGYIVLVSALYVSVPLVIWYRFMLSPRYVGGQKKEALFI